MTLQTLVVGAALILTQTPPARPLWTISGYLGGGEGGPGASMASHLERVGGFESKSVCFYVGCPDFPRFHRPARQWSVALGHTLGRRLGVRAMVGAGSFGWATGEGTSGSITRHWSATTVSAHLTYELPPAQWLKEAAFGASFGGGPILAWVRSGRGVPDAYPTDSSSEVTRLGVELRAAGTMWPGKHRWFFLGLEAGYRFLPGRTEGPYALDTGSGALPSFDVAYHHFTFGMVTGVRFPFP
ncbi:MAG TPA: hypothetical protein VFO67_21145 [Gemmatimonadales bacterium]|nr:hypothetical protein [Gemmatimonadales bacterium]